MTDGEIEAFLDAEVVARVGVFADGETYVVPVALVASGGALWGFSHEGRKLDMMRSNPRVCVELDRVRHLGSWRSVIVQGTFEELEGDEARRGTELIASRLASLATDDESRRRLAEAVSMDPVPAVYRIVIRSATGRVEGE